MAHSFCTAQAAFWTRETSPRLPDADRSVALCPVTATVSTFAYLRFFHECGRPALVLQATTLGLEGLGTRLRGSQSHVATGKAGKGKQEGEREQVTEDYIYFPLARVMGGQAVDSDSSSVVKLSTTEQPRLAQ